MDTNLEKLNQAFMEVGKRDGIDDFRLSSIGTTGLQLRSGTRIFFEYIPNASRLVLYSPLMKFPSNVEQAAQLFKAALALNFLSTNDDGELAASEHFQDLVYQRSIVVSSLNADRLDQAINEMIERRTVLIASLEQSTGHKPASKDTDKRHDRRAFARILERNR